MAELKTFGRADDFKEAIAVLKEAAQLDRVETDMYKASFEAVRYYAQGQRLLGRAIASGKYKDNVSKAMAKKSEDVGKRLDVLQPKEDAAKIEHQLAVDQARFDSLARSPRHFDSKESPADPAAAYAAYAAYEAAPDADAVEKAKADQAESAAAKAKGAEEAAAKAKVEARTFVRTTRTLDGTEELLKATSDSAVITGTYQGLNYFSC
jgi:hypothetical protein